MQERNYPYLGWVLMPSFKPKQITLTSTYNTWSAGEWDISESGKSYLAAEIFQTKHEAIAYGFAQLSKQQAALDKAQAAIYKRISVLQNVEKE